MSRQKLSKLNFAEGFPHLASAPIVEAVIHFAARATKPLSAEEWRSALARRLPEYPDCQPQHQLQWDAEFGPDGSKIQMGSNRWYGFQLTTADKLQIVQFNRDGLVFSRLQPYDRWETFATEAQRLWRVFVELADPVELHRLGVRFINRIGPIELADVGRYLRKPPNPLESLGLPLSDFLHRSTHDIPGEPLGVNLIQTVQPPAPPQSEGFSLVLDIDVFSTQAFETTSNLDECLTKMQWFKNKVFFSLLKNAAVKMLQSRS